MVDMHLPKPRCRYVANDSGVIVGWLVHGFEVQAYGIKSLDQVLGRWRERMLNKILTANATA